MSDFRWKISRDGKLGRSMRSVSLNVLVHPRYFKSITIPGRRTSLLPMEGLRMKARVTIGRATFPA